MQQPIVEDARPASGSVLLITRHVDVELGNISVAAERVTTSSAYWTRMVP